MNFEKWQTVKLNPDNHGFAVDSTYELKKNNEFTVDSVSYKNREITVIDTDGDLRKYHCSRLIIID